MLHIIFMIQTEIQQCFKPLTGHCFDVVHKERTFLLPNQFATAQISNAAVLKILHKINIHYIQTANKTTGNRF